MSSLDFSEKQAMADRALANRAFTRIAERDGQEQENEAAYELSTATEDAYDDGHADGYSEARGELSEDIMDTLESLAVKQDDSATRTGILLALANVNTLLSETNERAA